MEGLVPDRLLVLFLFIPGEDVVEGKLLELPLADADAEEFAAALEEAPDVMERKKEDIIELSKMISRATRTARFYHNFISSNSIWKHSIPPRKILHLPNEAEEKVVDSRMLKNAYYKLSKEYHPDHLQNYSEAERKQRKDHYLLIQDAYSFLRENPSFHSSSTLTSSSTASSSGASAASTSSQSYTTYQTERPEFKRGFQAFGLGVLFLFMLNLIMTKKVEKNISRTREMGWTIHHASVARNDEISEKK